MARETRPSKLRPPDNGPCQADLVAVSAVEAVLLPDDAGRSRFNGPLGADAEALPPSWFIVSAFATFFAAPLVK